MSLLIDSLKSFTSSSPSKKVNYNYQNEFEKKYDFDKRVKEARSLHSRYPLRVPIILYPSSKDQPDIEKNKYLVPVDINVSQFMYVIKKYIKIKSDEAIFIFTSNNTLVPNTWTVKELYDQYKKEDNFLYLYYSIENTFG
jgi:GABA(A) receptor-associated protein